MSQKYDKIAKTLEYLIHKHFLFKAMTQMPRFHAKTAELRLNCNNCNCEVSRVSGLFVCSGINRGTLLFRRNSTFLLLERPHFSGALAQSALSAVSSMYGNRTQQNGGTGTETTAASNQRTAEVEDRSKMAVANY